MNEISVLNIKTFKHELVVLRERLGDHLCKWYSPCTSEEKKTYGDDPKLVLSTFPNFVVRVIAQFAKLHLVPRYWGWWARQIADDFIFAKKMANDDSKIVYVPSPCKRTIKMAQKRGKKVVLLLANSEPLREYSRIVSEYDKFSIKNRYIYGSKKYEFGLADAIKRADYWINITEVSKKTYTDAGYDMSKSHVILDTGTSFPLQSVDSNKGKQKAFISTAYHCFIKGTHRLLLAWKKAGIKNVPLLLVGDLCDDMVEFVKNNGPFENVVFVGHCSTLKEWYKQYDAVGIILSLSEGSGRVTPEMMSYGFPIISSPDAICDTIVDGYNGSVVDPMDEEAIASALKYYAEDWSRVDALRQNVLNSVKTRTVDDYSREIADYLVSLI